jgi:hypothetical protein
LTGPRFSLGRALQLLSLSLEAAIGMGLLAHLALFLLWMQPRFSFLRAAVNVSTGFVILSIITFTPIVVYHFCQNRRRGTFALARLVSYCLLLNLIPTPLG